MSSDTRSDQRTDISTGTGSDDITIITDGNGRSSTPIGGPPRWGRQVDAARRRVHSALAPAWVDPRIGLAVAAGAGVLWGLLAGWWTPRGPLSSGEALWSIVISLVVGGLAGLVWRSRWAVLVTPIAFAAVFELVRIRTDGPTVDGLAMSEYGAIAFVVGRGFHGLMSLFPMVLGAAMGAGITRRLTTLPQRQTTEPDATAVVRSPCWPARHSSRYSLVWPDPPAPTRSSTPTAT